MKIELENDWYTGFSKKDPSQWTRQEAQHYLEEMDERISTYWVKKGRPQLVAIRKKLREILLSFPEESVNNEESLDDSSEEHNKPEDKLTSKNKSRIMYIEYKGDGLAGSARIGRVKFSKTGKSIYYGNKKFQSLKGGGYKANYFDMETGEKYWISGCKRKGDDTLYPDTIEIDEDVRQEYWCQIRNLPENVRLKRFRSEGKYTRKKPK